MKQSKTSSIPNIIGMLLIIVALVSAGGLYYTASIYTEISDTFVSVDSAINSVTVTRDITTDQVTIAVSILVSNPSSLDIEVYRIEYMTYMDRIASTVYNYDKYIGSGSTSDRNNTVKADSTREIEVTFILTKGSTYYDRAIEAIEGGPNVWTLIDGVVWFKIPGYGEKVQNKIGLFAMENVEVRHV